MFKKFYAIITILLITSILFSCQKKKTVETYNSKSNDVGFVEETINGNEVIKLYIKEDGTKLKDEWLNDSNNVYYFNDDNSMAKGFEVIDNNQYFFNENGTLQKEEFSDGNSHYILNKDFSIKESISLPIYKSKINPKSPDGGISQDVSQTGYFKFLNNNQKNEVNNAVDEFFNTYIDGKIDKNDSDWKFKREIAIIKYLVETTEYDNENYYKGTIPEIDYTPYAALINKKAVCDGFASAFALLAEKCEIPVKKVLGPDHAWNMVQLDDGNWYHIDSTWAICTADYLSYINLTDEQVKNLENGAGGINNHEYWDLNLSANGTKYGEEYLAKYLKDVYGINKYSLDEKKIEEIKVQKNDDNKNKDIKEISINSSEPIDFSSFEDKSNKTSGRIYNKGILLKANKWMSGEANVKIIFNPNYEFKTVTVALRAMLLDDSNSHNVQLNIDYKNQDWQLVNTKSRRTSAYDEFDRYFGIYVQASNVTRNGEKVKFTDTKFDVNKGNYEGDSYDAMCQGFIYDENVYTILFKDIKIDLNNDCKNMKLNEFVMTDYKDNNNDYILLWEGYDGNKQSEFAKGHNRGYCSATFLDTKYKTVYDESDRPEWDGELCTHSHSLLIENGNVRFVGGSVGPGENMMNNTDEKPHYSTHTGGDNQPYDLKYIGYGIFKPKKITKDGNEITAIYEFDNKPGTYEGLNYEVQILIKDGNNIIGRVLYKNAWHD